MGRLLAKNTITAHITQGCVAVRRQAVGFGQTQIDDKGDFG